MARTTLFLICFIPVLPGCRPFGFDQEIRLRRQEIRSLQKRIELRKDTPIFIPEFNALLDNESASIPDVVYLHVVRHLDKMSDPEVTRRVDLKVRYPDLTDKPGKVRGRFVRVTGRVANVWPETIKMDGRARRVFAGVLFFKGLYPVLFHVLEKPEVLYLKEDLVGLDGIFLKVIRYELLDGGRMRAPFVVGRRLLKYH